MARPQLYDTDLLLDAVVELVLESGAGAATAEAVTKATGAPSGTLYNRFGSRDGMLKAAWERSARRSQSLFLDSIAGAGDPRQSALAAGLSVLRFTRLHFADARLLVSVRRTDLLRPGAENEAKHVELNAPVVAALRQLAHGLAGRATPRVVETVTLATVDLPLGAVRRYLIVGRTVPASIAPPLTAAIDAALDTLERSQDE